MSLFCQRSCEDTSGRNRSLSDARKNTSMYKLHIFESHGWLSKGNYLETKRFFGLYVGSTAFVQLSAELSERTS